MTEDSDRVRDEGLPEPLDDEGEDRSSLSQNVGAFSMISRQIAMQNRMFDRTVEPMLQSVWQQMQEVLEALEEHREQVREVIETTIDLEEPWEYNSDKSEVHERAEQVAVRQLMELGEALEEIEDERLEAVRSRMLVGAEAYDGFVPDEDGEFVEVEPRLHEAIFVFISLQDGLMHWVCEQDKTVEPDKSYPQRNVYYSDTKQDALEEVYTSYYGIAPDTLFFENLEAFYHHRNYIMHGHPEAHFDENIATAAVLFFALTLHTVLEELVELPDCEQDDVEVSE